MTGNRISELRSLEGRQVCVALSDGGRIDDCQLVSAARGRDATIWIYRNGTDTFVPVADVVALWEAPPVGDRRVTWGRGQLIDVHEWQAPSLSGTGRSDPT